MVCLAMILLMTTNLKSQDLINYNLFISNPVLYNPAYTVDSSKIKAFVNSRLQWVGFEGAPKANTFGVSGNFLKNMGVGLTVSNFKQGLTSNTYVSLNYGYQAHFADNHFISLGVAFGALSDNLETNKISSNSDLTDGQLVNNVYKQVSITSRAGLSYFNKGFEFQLIMPQLLERKKVNTYTIGILSYDYKLNPVWNVKPVLLARGASTSPYQIDFNVVVTFRKTIWGQLGYRSNKSYLIGLGASYKSIDLGYAYQMETNELSTISRSTHEIQLIYRFGKR